MERPLDELIESAALPAYALHGNNAVLVTDVAFDSRRVVAGSLFCCIPGDEFDGHDFAADAVAGGAVALLCERQLPLPVAQLVVPDARAAMGLLAAAFHGHPSRALTMVGITGTNGKTTTCHLLANILRVSGLPTGVIGTLTGKHTTPEAPDLHARLAEFVGQGMQAAVLEVSSHALELHRVTGCHFDLAVFTNLGRDHLDLHGTVERYFTAKARLFEPGLSDQGLANVDDPRGEQLVQGARIPMSAYSIRDITELEVTPTSHSYRWRETNIRVGIGGAFNAMNSLAAATSAALLGVAPDVIARGLANAPTVPGRFQPVHAGQHFDVIIDFAHTPDGLREVLGAARPTSGQLIAVFGCGGDRDREKRPEMGAVAAELADSIVVTSDNPRSEDPQAIIDAVLAGVPDDYRHHVVSEVDRRRAFAAAFQRAKPGDVVVIAGKGHETTQTIGHKSNPFDDHAVATELLAVLR